MFSLRALPRVTHTEFPMMVGFWETKRGLERLGDGSPVDRVVLAGVVRVRGQVLGTDTATTFCLGTETSGPFGRNGERGKQGKHRHRVCTDVRRQLRTRPSGSEDEGIVFTQKGRPFVISRGPDSPYGSEV